MTGRSSQDRLRRIVCRKAARRTEQDGRIGGGLERGQQTPEHGFATGRRLHRSDGNSRRLPHTTSKGMNMSARGSEKAGKIEGAERAKPEPSHTLQEPVKLASRLFDGGRGESSSRAGS